MNGQTRSLIYIHIAVLLFGFSALFARLIDQSALVITGGRSICSATFFLIMVLAARKNLRLHSRRDLMRAIAAGFFFGVHLFGYFQAVQFSTVAIGVITFATLPIFTAFLEPLFFDEKLSPRTVCCAVLMLGGILITVPWGEIEQAPGTVPGLLIGLVATLGYALMSIINRDLTQKYDTLTIVFYEHLTLALLSIPVFWILRPVFSPTDLAWLAVAGIVVAAGAHYLFVQGLKRVKISTAGIIAGLEAVYAIVFASMLLREIPTANEIVGGLVVLSVATYMTLPGAAVPSGRRRNIVVSPDRLDR